MDKYIGNKKSILENIEEFMLKKKIKKGVFFDVFTGTTNVAQYFKQRGFSIISNDINEFCYVLQMTYIKNNEFPQFKLLLKEIENSGYIFNYKEVENLIDISIRKILNDKTYVLDYEKKTNYISNIVPLAKVITYLNDFNRTEKLTDEELFFYNHYTIYGNNSEFTSLRGTNGKRNYFSKFNSIKLGVLLEKIKSWYNNEKLISEMEFMILLTSIIEEVTLIANVNGTFHDFNRKKLYPNALVDMKLRVPILNVCNNDESYEIFMENSNNLKNNDYFKKINNNIDILYIDPPYNFRQYSSYYHLLNLIAKYYKIDDILEYGSKLSFARGQNMSDDIKSEYCYKETFSKSLYDLIDGIEVEHILISYYDENNHWNHGKEKLSYEGREAIINIFKELNNIECFDKEPYIFNRKNYQSQNGHRKKEVEELIFYAKKGI